MPAAPRPDKKATKVAHKILGTPPALRKQHKTAYQKYLSRRLLAEDTFRVR